MRHPRFIPPRSNPTTSETQSRLTALEQMLADQQRRITEQEQEITRQHARLAEQANTISRLRQNLESDTELRSDLRQGQTPADLLSPSLDNSADGQRVHATSRRSLLRLGGMGAAAGVVVAASNWYSSGSVAHAAGGSGDGTAIVQGSANVNTSQTGTILNPVASTGPTTLLTADNSTSTSTDSTATAGVKAVGPIETNGVIGVGNGTGGYGIWGQSDAGFGVV
ncbi:MAG TPA: hypothetical protein VFU63_03695, partial [Ktedonobacterales bacterium]|nr:hypothetical protein [Ktedonobacterales bacterium]